MTSILPPDEAARWRKRHEADGDPLCVSITVFTEADAEATAQRITALVAKYLAETPRTAVALAFATLLLGCSGPVVWKVDCGQLVGEQRPPVRLPAWEGVRP